MLSGKQKRYLRSQANHLSAIYQIGKDGLTSNQIKGIKEALEAHELIKIKVLETCPEDSHAVAIEISAQTKAEVVQIIGRMIILYKTSKERIYRLP